MTDLLELPFSAPDGRIPTAVLHRLIDAVGKLPGKRFVLTLKEQKRKRSLNQNAYYFGVLVKRLTVAFREAGNDMDELEVHEFLKNEVGKLTRFAVLPGTGEVVTLGRRQWASSCRSQTKKSVNQPRERKPMTEVGHNSKPRAGGVAVDQLKSIIARVEKLTEEKDGIAADIRDVFAEARGNGWDTKAIRTILKMRKMDASEREEQEIVLDTYLHALGMVPQPDLFDDEEAA